MRDKREKTVLPPRLHLEKPAHCDTHGAEVGDSRSFRRGGALPWAPRGSAPWERRGYPKRKSGIAGSFGGGHPGGGEPPKTTHAHNTQSSSWNPGRLCNPFEPKRWRAPGFGASRSRAARYQLAPRGPRPSGASGAGIPTRPVGAAAGTRAGPRVLAGGPVTFCPQVPPGCGRWSGARRSAL